MNSPLKAVETFARETHLRLRQRLGGELYQPWAASPYCGLNGLRVPRKGAGISGIDWRNIVIVVYMFVSIYFDFSLTWKACF